ncbi:MAG: ABC transporter ATP-binding protein [Deltaproteobacteria bacterium]|nr:ABC transporter ATP-binding protein [Deltaproteobacteria bacterium]MBW1929550.1 ABC transporter ATP-binding protein [Deltaproteobacteria bacterium]MBW2026491.1 ABC transporter ATP-binding protein [Deltaproteobacteria bacterium]MBW2126151.1 ABC transporter ATP-binding protein [Deltaproteobacteria bacterium]RLB18322.1 MAG: ABC transporter ATP-binding protein [Deltaproteobacteria bacterium]
MIQVEDLHKSFDGHVVLDGISFEIGKGQVVALIGGSGGGKSVLLKHLAGLMKPDKGRVIIDGADLKTLRGGQLRALRDRLGFLFQGGALFDSLTVYENVAFPLREKTKMKEREIREKVLKELELVGLKGAEDKYPSQISGGMVKRAALARALVRDPEIMLFDEPTTGLDPVIGQAILELIDACHKRISFTGIVVTHEIPRIFSYVDRVLMIYEGKLRVNATPQELMRSEDPVVKSFLGY